MGQSSCRQLVQLADDGAVVGESLGTDVPGAPDRICNCAVMDIGKIGVWTSYRRFGIERAGEAAKLIEQLGYSSWWVGGSPHVDEVRPVLEATSALAAATGS